MLFTSHGATFAVVQENTRDFYLNMLSDFKSITVYPDPQLVNFFFLFLAEAVKWYYRKSRGFYSKEIFSNIIVTLKENPKNSENVCYFPSHNLLQQNLFHIKICSLGGFEGKKNMSKRLNRCRNRPNRLLLSKNKLFTC